MNDVSDFDTLVTLIRYREVFEIKSISQFLEKSIFQDGKEFFDVWMYHANEQIQSLAESFGERYFLESALATLNNVKH